MTSMQEAWPFNSRSSTARRTPQSSSSSVPAETVETAGIELKQANAGSDCMEGCCQDIETEERQQITPGPPTGAVIGGILGALAFIGIIIGIIFFIRKRQEDGEGPPKHKPPPPVKAGSSTEMLNKPSEPPTATETAPLSPGEVYYEPTGREPVTNLDDETTGALNGGAQPVLDDSAKYGNINELKEHATDGHHGNDMESSSHEPPAANISRGESFVSPAMYV